jgi:hypothetical protein
MTKASFRLKRWHWIISLCALELGCGRPAEELPAATNEVPPFQASASSSLPSNPFVGIDKSAASSEDLAGCLSSRIRIPPVEVGAPLSGQLDIENGCRVAVAILTAPIERRNRLTHDSRFAVEDGISRVYGIAYVFRKEVGLPKKAFRGDGGVDSAIHPDFAVIPAGQRMSLPINGGTSIGLEPGNYGLALFTIAVPVHSDGPILGAIDLRNSVAELQKTRMRVPTFSLPAAAIRLGPATYFEVKATLLPGGSSD